MTELTRGCADGAHVFVVARAGGHCACGAVEWTLSDSLAELRYYQRRTPLLPATPESARAELERLQRRARTP